VPITSLKCPKNFQRRKKRQIKTQESASSLKNVSISCKDPNEPEKDPFTSVVKQKFKKRDGKRRKGSSEEMKTREKYLKRNNGKLKEK